MKSGLALKIRFPQALVGGAALTLLLLPVAGRAGFFHRCGAKFAAFLREESPPEQALYPTITLPEKQLKRDASAGVHYFPDPASYEMKFDPETGTVFSPDGHELPDGVYFYYMNERGQFHGVKVYDDDIRLLHHSSLPGGGPVAGVGNLEIRGGKIHSIDPCSGHYKPPPWMFDNVLAQLAERGIVPPKISRDCK